MRNWKINGYALTQAAHNIRVIPAGLGLPGRRGEDIQVPFRDGSRFTRKPLDSRTITLGMQVFGEENIDTLNKLFGKEGLQTITAEVEGEMRTIYAEIINPVWYHIEVKDYARFTVDLHCPDPYFYGALVEETFALSTTEHTVVLENPGTAPCRKAKLKVTGAVEGIKVECTNTDTWVRWGGDVDGGELIIDVEKYTAELNEDNHVGLITHAGDPAFLVLDAGDNSLTITCDSAPSGSLTVEFLAPYF